MTLKLQDQDRKVLIDWWQWLDDNRDSRARLRRAVAPDDILLLPDFARFMNHRIETDGKRIGLHQNWRVPDNLPAAALICGLLARVKTRSQALVKQEVVTEQEDGLEKKARSATFAAQLAMPGKSGSGPVMSELRFQRLQKSDGVETFYRQMCRAIDLLGGVVHIESMIGDVLDWYREFHYGADREPRNRLAVRWATDYFITLNHFKFV